MIGHRDPDVHRIGLVAVQILARPPLTSAERLAQGPDHVLSAVAVPAEVAARWIAAVVDHHLDSLAGGVGLIEIDGHQVPDAAVGGPAATGGHAVDAHLGVQVQIQRRDAGARDLRADRDQPGEHAGARAQVQVQFVVVDVVQLLVGRLERLGLQGGCHQTRLGLGLGQAVLHQGFAQVSEIVLLQVTIGIQGLRWLLIARCRVSRRHHKGQDQPGQTQVSGNEGVRVQSVGKHDSSLLRGSKAEAGVRPCARADCPDHVAKTGGRCPSGEATRFRT